MADLSSFSSFESFKSEVAQRTRKALMQQQAAGDGVDTAPVRLIPTPRADVKRPHSRADSRAQDVSTPRSSARPKSATNKSTSGGLPSPRVSIFDRVPDRLKYTPTHSVKSSKSNLSQENRKPQTAPSGYISKRLLQLAPTKGKTVNLYPNDGHYNKQGIHIVLPDSMNLLLDTGRQRLDLPSAAWYVYRAHDGALVTHIEEIEDEDCLVVATKEAFKPQIDTTKRPKPVPPVQYTKALRCKIESTLDSPHLNAGQSPSAEVKHMISDTPKLLRRFRLAYNTPLQREHRIIVDNPKSLANVRILCGLGAVSLRNQSLASLEGMMPQPDMVEFYLQNNMLQDLDHSIPQPKLKELRLENNFIVSFKGFAPQPKLEQIWLDPNPICQHPHYKLMVAILQNNNYLVRIDDQLIDREDRLLARALAPYVSDALRAGWLLSTEETPDSDFDVTVEEFQQFHIAQSHYNNPIITHERNSPVPEGVEESMEESFHSQPGGRNLGGSIELSPEVLPEWDYDHAGHHDRSDDTRQRVQIERLTDALVRASQKGTVREKLLAETTGQLRETQEMLRIEEEMKYEKAKALEDAEKLLSKRSEQCRQLYEIVGALENRLAEQPPADGSKQVEKKAEQASVHASCQTDELPAGELGGAEGEQLAAERRARNAERTALESKIQRLELSAKASEASSHQGHLSLFSDVRARLVSELSYSIPDAKVLMAIIQDIDKHVSEFGGSE